MNLYQKERQPMSSTPTPWTRVEEATWDVIYELLKMAHDRAGRPPGTSDPRFATVRAAIYEAMCLIPADDD